MLIVSNALCNVYRENIEEMHSLYASEEWEYGEDQARDIADSLGGLLATCEIAEDTDDKLVFVQAIAKLLAAIDPQRYGYYDEYTFTIDKCGEVIKMIDDKGCPVATVNVACGSLVGVLVDLGKSRFFD